MTVRKWADMALFSLIVAGLLAVPSPIPRVVAEPQGPDQVVLSDPPKDKGSEKKSKSKKSTAKKPKALIRWGKRRNETNEEYDKRFSRVEKLTKMDRENDLDGGNLKMWTYKGHPFIVRTDIDKRFTAETAMYMEMLHREYGEAYSKLLGGVPAQVKEKIEVIVFSERETYIENGGSPGSGGFFMSFGHLVGDRGPHWPARRYRLQQFTDGIKEFARWPKGTLKHEAAHMELQLRLGNTLWGGAIGVPVDCPRWWNEGHASVFEYWDFDKTVEENFAEIPNRGRYAPVIRRIYDTDRWKEFNYVWTIDPKSWHGDMTSDQGFLNYSQAWSLAAYMMNTGMKGRKDFRAIFHLSKRVGTDYQTTLKGEGLRAWETAFPPEDRERLEKNWLEWVAKNVPREKRVPDEDWMLLQQGFNPKHVDKLEPYTEEDMKELSGKIKKERDRRKRERRIEK
jgi:hypothetical protein